MTKARSSRGSSASRRHGWVLAVLLCLIFAGGAAADRWYVHYENAEQALEQEDWSKAIEEVQLALERKGDSGSRVRSYGMRVVDYFPYLKLGIAYHHLGQDAAAREAFGTEQQLGAIRDSPESLRQLEQYRQLVTDSLAQTESEAQQREEEIVSESLTRARALERQGLVEEAMRALASGLAADPDNPVARELMAELRERSVRDEKARRDEEEARRNLGTAEDLLVRGEFEAAAGLLRQVLAVDDAPKPRRLLKQAQEAIALSVAEHEQQQQIADTLVEVRRLQALGSWQEALGQLERVFAFSPDHDEGGRLREQLLDSMRQAQQSRLVDETLEVGEAEFAAGDFEAALSAANRVLAWERGNEKALGLVRRSYGEISRRLLGAQVVENLPPAIRFADSRREIQGELLELVQLPSYQLTGIVIDRSAVSLQFFDGQGRTLEGSQTSQTFGETVITEFRVGYQLSPGEALLAVVASDTSGATSRAEYQVFFRLPWWRSFWPWAIAGTVGTLLAAGIGWRRRGRKRALRQRRFNPYVAGGPILDPSLFFGREPLIQRILQTVHNNSLLLYGERRIGKTSLLHQLHLRLENLDDPEFDFRPVYIDLQGTPEETFFAVLADQIFEALEPEATRSPALGREARYTHHELVRELHGLLKRLREASAKKVKVVLLVDEVDELNHYDPRVNQSLRSLFMRRFAENLAAVVAGVGIRKEWEKEGSPWYNFFEEIEVQAISESEAQRLVVEPIRHLFQFEEGVAERIVSLSLGKPFLIQRRCLALVGRLYEEGRSTISLADVASLEEADGFISTAVSDSP